MIKTDIVKTSLENIKTQLNSLVEHLEENITFDFNTSEFDKMLYNFVCNARNNTDDAIKMLQMEHNE